MKSHTAQREHYERYSIVDRYNTTDKMALSDSQT